MATIRPYLNKSNQLIFLTGNDSEMEDSVFAPYPNRNIPKIVGSFAPDTLIYGSLGNVIVVKHSCDGASLQVIDSAHNWIFCMSVVPDNAPEHLARTFVTCGKDGYVRLWNIDTLSIVKAHRTHWTQKPEKVQSVIAADWSPANPNLIVSIAENGCVVFWHVTENLTYKIKLPEGIRPPFTLACSPQHENMLAIGSGGVINVVSIEQTRVKVNARLRAFSQPVLDLAWQPSVENPILAATSKSGQLSLWDTQNEKCIKTWRLDAYESKTMNIKTSGNIYPLLWMNSTKLLTRSGPSIIALDCATLEAIQANTGRPWKILETPHTRDFQFLVKSKHAGGDRVWTFGSDRKMVESAVGEGGGIKRSIGVMNGGNICMAVCPHDPQLVALAGYDATVRLWNITKPTGSAINNSKNVLDKVMSLCWHHTKENTLLFGTETGRIGVMEGSRPPRLLHPCSSRQVYWMCWGPAFPSLNVTHQVLYVVTDKKLFVYKDLTENAEPVDLSTTMTLPKSGVTDASWKPDMSLLAVGGRQGEIRLFEPTDTAPLHTLKIADSVQYLAWHPEMTTSDTEGSVCRDWFTCGSRDSSGVVVVWAVTRNAEGLLTTDVKATLRGHSESVQSVAWSPHDTGRLVTASGDGTARIWNALNETVLFIYQCMIDSRNWLTIWNPVNHDFMMNSTKLGTVVTWRISNKTSIDPAKLETTRKTRRYPKKKKHPCEIAKLEEGALEEKKGDEKEVKVEKKKDEQIAQLVTCIENRQGIASKMEKCWSKSKQENEFVTCHRLLNASINDRPHIYSLPFFGPNEAMEGKVSELMAGMEGEEKELTMVWQGRVKEQVEQQIAEGRVSEQVVALAASVSPRLWHLACLALAQQYRIAAKYNKAACFLVAASRIHQAIEVLVEGKLYTEALCLARSQLADDDPAVLDITKAFAHDLIKRGNFSRAAECLIFVGDYSGAADCLFKSCDRVGMGAAALAARLAGDREKEHLYALSAFASNLLHNKSNDYNYNLDQLEIPSLQLLQSVVDSLQALDCSSSESLLETLKKAVPSENMSECYQELQRIPVKIPHEKQEDLVKEWVKVHELSLAASAGGERARCQHTLKALNAAHQQSPAQLCLVAQKLSPGLQLSSIFTYQSALGISLRAFLCLALLHKADINEKEGLALLPLIATLKEDLLHEKAISYHRAKIQLPLWEKKLSNLSSFSQSVRPFPRPKRVNSSKQVDALSNGIAQLSCSRSGDEINGASESSQSSPQSTNSENGVNEDLNDSEERKSTENGQNSKNPEIEEDVMTKLVAERNQLVITISKIEAERTVVPNPVIGLSLLRCYFTALSQDSEAAKENLDLIMEKYLPMINSNN